MNYLKTFESYNLDSFFNKLDLFLSGDIKNKWIYDNDDNPIISAYVRKSKRYINGRPIEFFDLANISIDESHWGQRIFQNIIKRLIDDYQFNIYIESILNPVVKHVCKKFGFTTHNYSNQYLIKNPT